MKSVNRNIYLRMASIISFRPRTFYEGKRWTYSDVIQLKAKKLHKAMLHKIALPLINESLVDYWRIECIVN